MKLITDLKNDPWPEVQINLRTVFLFDQEQYTVHKKTFIRKFDLNDKENERVRKEKYDEWIGWYIIV